MDMELIRGEMSVLRDGHNRDTALFLGVVPKVLANNAVAALLAKGEKVTYEAAVDALHAPRQLSGYLDDARAELKRMLG